MPDCVMSIGILDECTCQTPVYSLELPCTCIRIFNLSRGATAVRDLQRKLHDGHFGMLPEFASMALAAGMQA